MWQYPIIDLHASWLVINPIQGCPNQCKYCFLNGVQLTAVKPKILVSSKEAVKQLKESKLYNKDIPLCIESQSDAFSTPDNIKYVENLLKELDKEKVMNTKVFITKCKIPKEFIKKIKEFENKGHKFIFFLSYSGLDNNIEVGVNKENIKNNFINLSKNGLDVIHYWRPFVPQNSTEEKILEVYNFVKKYARCSIAIGLKVQDNIVDNMDFWSELKETKDITKAESVWDKKAYEYIYLKKSMIKEDYPIYQSTSCALAYVLHEAERDSLYNKEACKNYNKCPENQRKVCEFFYNNIHNNITKDEIIKLLDKLEVKYSNNVEIKIDNTTKIITLNNIELNMKEFTYLTQTTKYKIYAKKSNKDYYWNTSVNNANTILL